MREPVEHGVDESVVGDTAQLGDLADVTGAGRPGEHGLDVDGLGGAGQREPRGCYCREGVLEGEQAATRGHPRAVAPSGEQASGHVARQSGEPVVEPGGGELVPDGVPGVRGAQHPPMQVGEDAAAEVGLVAVSEDDEPSVLVAAQQRLPHSKRGRAGCDRDLKAGVLKLRRPGPGGLCADAEDTAADPALVRGAVEQGLDYRHGDRQHDTARVALRRGRGGQGFTRHSTSIS